MDRIRGAGFALALAGVGSIVVSILLTALTPWHLDPLQVFIGIVVAGAILWLRSVEGGGSGAEGQAPGRQGTPDGAEAKRLLVEKRRRDREELIELHRAGLIDDDQLDRSLKHLLDTPIQGPQGQGRP
jgi:hypothetical protein